MEYVKPRFIDCGEAALSVEFGEGVDPAINARVLTLDARLRAAPPQGLRETTPTYRALLLRYEPLEISRGALVAAVEGLLAPGGIEEKPSRPALRP
ncbi:MAG: allophanate hydrolase subunit 1, partial [Alphaproteobacteria bacterium]|nr:allophanate hydrolase subunit 1 [Alphaproteobacteria bacterium]